MSNFVNTVDSVGDEALTNSIIDRSITELADNISTSIGQNAFRACAALASVNFPNVTSVGLAAFYECKALAKADFASCVAFGNNTFYGCSALTALILRNTEQLSTLTGNLSGTAIASGTGYIYVPLALVDAYKAASGWSTYAAQIRAIEDYPEVCDPYTWDIVFKCIDNGTYASVYKVGDCVELDLGTEGVVNMQIAGIDVDTLADGSGTAPISWISRDLLKTYHRMNAATSGSSAGRENGMVGGWEASELRSYLAETIKPLIQEDVANRIRDVIKTQMQSNSKGTLSNQTTTDGLWIPGYSEMATSDSLYYGLYFNEYSRIKYMESLAKNFRWWLRDAYSYSDARIISNNGEFANAQVGANISGIALGFCT